jgi:tRNA1(Val) A37 N6-methylase TrmN6
LHFIHQIYPDTEITGIEPDIPSFQTAIHNFSVNNIQHAQIINNDFFIWGKSTIQKFDLIVSNPPFFENQLESVNAQKRQARHFSDQGFADFFHLISSLLTSIGKAWLMLPYTPLNEINPSLELEKNFDHWKNHATLNKLLIQDFITVKANESKKPHIVFIQLSRETTKDMTG